MYNNLFNVLDCAVAKYPNNFASR